tara:strand:+ start:283 stop:456 length:174 start_codon:yes stop_codon:yes gene_type:complete
LGEAAAKQQAPRQHQMIVELPERQQGYEREPLALVALLVVALVALLVSVPLERMSTA